MAASFPTSKKTFSAVVNGVTKLIASLFNSPYDEIEAIETFIGATGASQANNDSVTNLLYNYRSGCLVEYKSASELYVRSGEIMITDVSGNKRLRRNPTDTTVTWAFLDTGAEGNAVYYVYATADGTASTFDVVISLADDGPADSTFFKLLGNFSNSTDIVIDSFSNTIAGKSLGVRTTKSTNTVYLAEADGFVVAYGTVAGDNEFYGYTDSSNPPTTILTAFSDKGGDASDSTGSITMPVRKGEYWKVTVAYGTVSVSWIPLC
jgi:hypothetical protein